MQCRHEIAESNGVLRLEMIDPRHFFHSTVTNKVLRGGSIHMGPSEFSATDGILLTADEEGNPDLVPEPVAGSAENLFHSENAQEDTNGQSQNPSARSGVITHKRLSDLFSEVVSLSLAHCQEKVVYGAGIHFLNLLKDGATNIEEELDETIRRYNSMFSSTSKVSFASSSSTHSFLEPTKPAAQPGSRGPEKRLKKASEPVKGSTNERACSWCGRHSSIKDCREYTKYGRRLTTDLERSALTTSLAAISSNSANTSYQVWPHQKEAVLYSGKPTKSNHIVLSGLYQFQSDMCPIVVADVQFIAEGGKPLVGYDHVPMKLDEVNKILYKWPKIPGKKHIVVSNILAAFVFKN